MIYRKADRIAFMLVPRTGSTSLRESLVANGFKYPIVFSDTDYGFAWHATYRQSVEAFPNLLNYRIYGVYRDPVDRFSSGLRYAAESLGAPDANYDALIDRLFRWKPHSNPPGILGEIFKPQVDWLDGPNVTVISYSNAASTITDIVGLTTVLPRMNVSTRPSGLSAKAIDFAKERYAADYNLADSFRLAA